MSSTPDSSTVDDLSFKAIRKCPTSLRGTLVSKAAPGRMDSNFVLQLFINFMAASPVA